MTLTNDTQARHTREKLCELEARYETRLQETPADSRVHELTLQSLKRTINQLREELTRYEHAQATRRSA